MWCRHATIPNFRKMWPSLTWAMVDLMAFDLSQSSLDPVYQLRTTPVMRYAQWKEEHH